MEVKNFEIEGLKLIINNIFEDERGYFTESYHKERFSNKVHDVNFIQENKSKSLLKGTVRGLHAQKPPNSQAKLVNVVKGSILDVAVDIRKKSKTYGKWIGITLKEDDHSYFFIPSGFLHGFITLEDNSVISYKCSDYYKKNSEIGVIYNDKDLQIDWHNNSDVIISSKDSELGSFRDLNSPF